MPLLIHGQCIDQKRLLHFCAYSLLMPKTLGRRQLTSASHDALQYEALVYSKSKGCMKHITISWCHRKKIKDCGKYIFRPPDPTAADIVCCFLSNAAICRILFHLHKFTNKRYRLLISSFILLINFFAFILIFLSSLMSKFHYNFYFISLLCGVSLKSLLFTFHLHGISLTDKRFGHWNIKEKTKTPEKNLPSV